MATTSHNGRNLPSDGHALYTQLMDRLERVQIAQRIRKARLEAGLHQWEVADLLKVHKNTISNWESETDPITSWDRLQELADVLRVSRRWLIHGDHENLDPQDALRARFVDALQELQESQADVHEKLDRALIALERLEGSLSRQLGPQPAQGTTGPDSASIRPQ